MVSDHVYPVAVVVLLGAIERESAVLGGQRERGDVGKRLQKPGGPLPRRKKERPVVLNGHSFTLVMERKVTLTYDEDSGEQLTMTVSPKRKMRREGEIQGANSHQNSRASLSKESKVTRSTRKNGSRLRTAASSRK